MRPFNLYCVVGEQAGFSVAMLLSVVGTAFPHLFPKGIKFPAIMQNMIFDSVFEVDSVLENKSDFFIVADSILNKRI